MRNRLERFGTATESSPGLFLLASVALTVVLHFVPYARYVGYPLMLLSTFVHEMGHGVAGWLAGGTFHSFRMAWDGSGVALVSVGDSRVASAFVSAGGLVGPACAAAIGFVLARRAGTSRVALLVGGVLLLVADAWLVRSACGFVFVTLFALSCLYVGVRARAWLSQLFVLFLSVQLSLSVYSRGDYLFTDVANTAWGTSPSDVANMSKQLFLPYWFWGLVCGAFSLLVLGVGGWLFLRSVAPSRPALVAPRVPVARRA